MKQIKASEVFWDLVRTPLKEFSRELESRAMALAWTATLNHIY